MNRHIAGLTMIVISLCIAATSMASTVRYDYDREVDFTKWQVAAWRAMASTDMEERRISKAIEDGFRNRGYAVVEDKERADFLIAWHATAWQDVSVSNNYWGPLYGRTLRVDREMKGALVIDVYDKKTGQVAWHGVVSDALARDPEEADRKTAKAVEKLLKKFPARGGVTSP